MDERLPVLLSERAIRAKVGQLARRISRDYRGRGELLLVGVLRGAFIFLADLARRLTIERQVEFMAVTTYGGGTRRGEPRLLLDLACHVRSRHVLLVEDIVDSGTTLRFLLDVLGPRGPASLACCALVRKPTPSALSLPLAYLGFEIPDVWAVGYGLDCRGRYRCLPYIAQTETTTPQKEGALHPSGCVRTHSSISAACSSGRSTNSTPKPGG